MTGARFVRFQSPQVSERGIRVGVFGLVNLLGKHGHLTPEDEQLRRTRNRWFDDAYPDPSTVDPAVYEPAVNPGAVAWFKKDAAAHLIAATLEHCRSWTATASPGNGWSPTTPAGSSTTTPTRWSSSLAAQTWTRYDGPRRRGRDGDGPVRP